MTIPKPGDTIDITIKGVQFAYDHNNDHNPGRFSIRADDGRRYTMPPQAAITSAGQADTIDAATLRKRIDNALRAIDNMVDEQTLDLWTARAIRKQIDPNPRHWPPQPGDVWHDGFPFGDSLWFACHHEPDGENPDWPSRIVMTNTVVGTKTKTPQDLLEYAADLTLLYRKRGDQ